MADDHKDETAIPDPAELAELWANIGEKSQEIVKSFLARQDTLNSGPIDPLNVGNAFFELTQQMLNNPAKMIEAQISLWQDYMELWQATTRSALGEESQPVVTPQQGDNRFKNEAWNDDGLFDFIKQSYLLTARWVQNTVHDVEGLDEKTAEKVDFYTRQYVDALAPTNFLMTNPQVLKKTFDSKGENILKGLEHLLEDLERGKGKLSIKMVDQDAFDVGENIATTAGKVVFQNDLIQLLQFSPTTKKVAEVPLLIIPPWINKYYILDLREKNSFIRWAVSQGLTVFCISWVNPDKKLARKSFEDYMIEGPLAALAAIESATGQKEANAIGYCLGGTLLAATLACMRKSGDDRIKAATFFTSMIDFEEPGELGVFIDDDQLAFIDEKMKERGYLDGSEMATTFNMLPCKRPHMVVRYKQLSYGQGALPLRFVVLELGFHPHAGGHAQFFLPAQNVSREQTRRARRYHTHGHRRRPLRHRYSDFYIVDPGRPHRTLEINVSGDADLRWTGDIYLSSFRPHRRCSQSTRARKIRVLDECQ